MISNDINFTTSFLSTLEKEIRVRGMGTHEVGWWTG
jgi:hypothetical protein